MTKTIAAAAIPVNCFAEIITGGSLFIASRLCGEKKWPAGDDAGDGQDHDVQRDERYGRCRHGSAAAAPQGDEQVMIQSFRHGEAVL